MPVRCCGGRDVFGRAGVDDEGRGALLEPVGRGPLGRAPLLDVPGRAVLPVELAGRGALGRGAEDDVGADGLADVGDAAGRGFAVALPVVLAGFGFTSSVLISSGLLVGFNSSAIPSSFSQAFAHKNR